MFAHKPLPGKCDKCCTVASLYTAPASSKDIAQTTCTDSKTHDPALCRESVKTMKLQLSVVESSPLCAVTGGGGYYLHD